MAVGLWKPRMNWRKRTFYRYCSMHNEQKRKKEGNVWGFFFSMQQAGLWSSDESEGSGAARRISVAAHFVGVVLFTISGPCQQEQFAAADNFFSPRTAKAHWLLLLFWYGQFLWKPWWLLTISMHVECTVYYKCLQYMLWPTASWCDMSWCDMVLTHCHFFYPWDRWEPADSADSAIWWHFPRKTTRVTANLGRSRRTSV